MLTLPPILQAKGPRRLCSGRLAPFASQLEAHGRRGSEVPEIHDRVGSDVFRTMEIQSSAAHGCRGVGLSSDKDQRPGPGETAPE
jgi:hypothetical protein